ncbi:unnamed protein product, partial [Ectocarpus sp. 12 AP-2014]
LRLRTWTLCLANEQRRGYYVFEITSLFLRRSLAFIRGGEVRLFASCQPPFFECVQAILEYALCAIHAIPAAARLFGCRYRCALRCTVCAFDCKDKASAHYTSYYRNFGPTPRLNNTRWCRLLSRCARVCSWRVGSTCGGKVR